MNDLQKDLFNTLYETYGSMMVSKKQASEVIGRSRASMDNDRYAGKGIPYFQDTPNGDVKYSIHDLVHYLTTNSVKTA